MQGTVKKWFLERGFGFIIPEDGIGGDLFVHFTGIVNKGPGRRNLTVGDTVEYATRENERGLIAVDVEVVQDAL